MRGYGILFFLLISLSLVVQAAKKKQEEDVNAATKPQPKPIQFPNSVILDISNPGDKIVHTEANYNGWTTSISSPISEHNVVEVNDGSSSIWKGDGCTEKCFSVTRHLKDGLDIMDLNMFARSGKCSHKYYMRQDGSWKEIEKEVYDEKRPKSDTYTLRNGTEFEAKVEYAPAGTKRAAPPEGQTTQKATAPPKNPYTFKTNPLPKKDESQKSQNASGQEQAKQKLEIEGIDSETFALSKSEEGGVSVVTCAPKIGKNSSSFKYKEEVVHSGMSISKVILYLDEGLPKLALLKTMANDGKLSTLYKYRENNEWKASDETTHNTKLGELKKKHPTAPAAKPTESPQNGHSGEGAEPTKVESGQAQNGRDGPNGKADALVERMGEDAKMVKGGTTHARPSGGPNGSNGTPDGQPTVTSPRKDAPRLATYYPETPTETPTANTSKLKVQSTEPTPGKEPREVELDIMDIDANIFTVQDSKEGDVPIKTISVKSVYRLTEIYSLNVPIWSSTDEHAKTPLTSSGNPNTPLIVQKLIAKHTKNVDMQLRDSYSGHKRGPRSSSVASSHRRP